MHIYQRTDSFWADRYTTRVSDYPVGWDAKHAELLPAFVRYNLANDSLTELRPEPNLQPPLDPKEFGDDWSEPMDSIDKTKITSYFKSFSHLEKFFDFIRVRLGGIEHIVELSKRRINRGLTFEAPRNSFMMSIDNEIFDDMLNGNFMKVTLHGKFGVFPLYPDFNLYVTKYGDNGRAKSKDELKQYFAAYRNRFRLGFLRRQAEQRLIRTIRDSITEDGAIFRACAKTYHWLKSSRVR
jgi:hypothetical protein